MLDEPPRPTRRERRLQARGDRAERPPDASPAEGDGGVPGSRQARRARADRRRFWLMLVVVAALLGLTVLAGELIRSGSDPSASGNRDASPAPAAPVETLLLGHRATDGRLDTLVLVGAEGDQASVLLLPVGTQVEVPSLGPQVLADLPNDDDTELLETTVENLLGVDVAETLVVDDAGLNAALAPAGQLDVVLSHEVQFEGSPDEILSAGTQRARTGQAARLLVSRQPGSELDRLVTVQDVLDAWFTQLSRPAIARRTRRAEPALGALVAAARADDRRTDTLPVESLSTGGDEAFKPRSGDVEEYAAAAFGDALLVPDGKRPRVEILNGTGAVGLAQTIAAQIVPAGGQVTLAGNLRAFGLHNTQVVYYRSEDRRAAQRLLRALGCGELKQADREIGVVDVTILAGADCFRTGTAPAPS